uniref:Cystatin-A-like n=1 Tax=Crassostrea virginica TaxID=6565 RepID=A0A8B8ATR7_CRAVI|nr:cystatin-A-like [Crassostrea virginica]
MCHSNVKMANKLYVLGVCLCFLGMTAALGVRGFRTGWISSESRPIDPRTLDIVNSVKDGILARLTADDKTGIFEPISVKTQVTTGVNYYVKIKTGADRYIHVHLYRRFRSTSLVGIQTGKTLGEEITYF